MAHGAAREGKWKGNWWMEWVASTLHTTSENGVSNITTADAHTSDASSRLNWRPRWFKWTSPFRRKTKPDFCACAITFQTQSTRDDDEECWRLGRHAGRSNGRMKVHDALQHHEQWDGAEARELIVTERIITKTRCSCMPTAAINILKVVENIPHFYVTLRFTFALTSHFANYMSR